MDNISKILRKALARVCPMLLCTVSLLGSCDYLDVAPEKRATLDDAMKNKKEALNWLQSLYMVVGNTAPTYFDRFESSTDEFVLPELWGHSGQVLSYGQGSSKWSIQEWDNVELPWTQCYGIIGHCHVFLQQLEKKRPLYVTDADVERFQAEIKFVKAYAHFKLLEMYGPVPIIDHHMPQNLPVSEYPGRTHFDACVDYIVKLLDESADYFDKNLPVQYVMDETWGRANAVVCKALKARLLLYAASPLWNGSFPYPDWKNTNYVNHDYPEYGKELVSHTYDPQKWQRAKDACKDALEYAIERGERKLLDIETARNLITNQQVDLPYVPGVPAGTEAGREFLERVLLMRYVTSSDETQGNHEFILGMSAYYDKDVKARLPKHIYKQSSGDWWNGWNGLSPCLYSIEHFYTKNGELPSNDSQFAPKGEWLTSAGLSDRPQVIKLNANREPRFYATFSFDGDDYSPEIANGEPLTIDFLKSSAQGYEPSYSTRDMCLTGYYTKKYIAPDFKITANGDNSGNWYPKAIIRLAELYLNMAECCAETGDNEGVLRYLNPIRERAGIRPLAMADFSGQMTAREWVRTERFIELWGEGQRYYDVRRWMTAPEQLASGKREGLDSYESRIENPTFGEFNRRVQIKQPFTWDNRMYLMPIQMDELYSNPQLVQSPGY